MLPLTEDGTVFMWCWDKNISGRYLNKDTHYKSTRLRCSDKAQCWPCGCRAPSCCCCCWWPPWCRGRGPGTGSAASASTQPRLSSGTRRSGSWHVTRGDTCRARQLLRGVSQRPSVSCAATAGTGRARRWRCGWWRRPAPTSTSTPSPSAAAWSPASAPGYSPSSGCPT